MLAQTEGGRKRRETELRVSQLRYLVQISQGVQTVQLGIYEAKKRNVEGL